MVQINVICKVVLTRQEGRVYIITLNRPKALNALNADMIHALTPFFKELVNNKDKVVVGRSSST